MKFLFLGLFAFSVHAAESPCERQTRNALRILPELSVETDLSIPQKSIPAIWSSDLCTKSGVAHAFIVDAIMECRKEEVQGLRDEIQRKKLEGWRERLRIQSIKHCDEESLKQQIGDR